MQDGPEVLKITGATDRVYEATPPETKILANSKSLFTLTRDNFKDVVVWNPYVEGASSMGDFEPKTGWKNMVLKFLISLILDMRGGRQCGGMAKHSSWRFLERSSGYESTSLNSKSQFWNEENCIYELTFISSDQISPLVAFQAITTEYISNLKA